MSWPPVCIPDCPLPSFFPSFLSAHPQLRFESLPPHLLRPKTAFLPPLSWQRRSSAPPVFAFTLPLGFKVSRTSRRGKDRKFVSLKGLWADARHHLSACLTHAWCYSEPSHFGMLENCQAECIHSDGCRVIKKGLCCVL